MASHENKKVTVQQQVLDQSNRSSWLSQALRDMGSSLMLEDNLLSKLPYIQKLAREKYFRRFSPAGFALREVLTQCIDELSEELATEPGQARESRFLLLRPKGFNVTQIAEELGISRSYCSSTIQKRAIKILLAKFTATVSEERTRKNPRTKDHIDLT